MLLNRKKRAFITFALVISLTLVSLIVWQVWIKPEPALPKYIEAQLNFIAMLPKNNDVVILEKQSFKYDKESSVLSVVVIYKNSPITITEQAYPDTLIYEKLIGPLKLYDEVQTKSGKAALTRPDAARGSQVGVINANNQILMFAKTTKDLSNVEWQQFFNQFYPIN